MDDLLRRLRTSRFLAVVGTSGSGKSSLVRSGLIPSLQSGLMTSAGSSWRIATLRPGSDPIGNLAAALDSPGVLGMDGELASTNRIMLDATLHRSSEGLVEAVKHARIPDDENVLVLVDQFEELFRFRRSNASSQSHDQAVAFVRLLLEAANQDDVPIYIAITMRSDFIGDCMDFPGLAQAVNQGQYLVPRMTRDQLRSAITGPAAVGGGRIAQRLVLRLLNDMGGDQDQLPVLQHALMRTWDHWQLNRGPESTPGQPSSQLPADSPADSIDLTDYEAVGTLKSALSMHAEEAFEEASNSADGKLTEKMFKALTDTYTDSRGVRRPTSVRELANVCEVTEADVARVVDIFRRPGRWFLMPPANTPLLTTTVIDISHESLMRTWTRLVEWAEEERLSATAYVRLAQAARWHAEGSGGLWRSPELDIGLHWRETAAPTAAWAQRYDPAFTQAMDFLNESENLRNKEVAEKERERRRKLRRTQAVALVLAVLLLAASMMAILLRRERNRAESNLQVAKQAIDETLSSAGSDQAREASGIPEMEEFRKQLLDKAREYYDRLTMQNSNRELLRMESAAAHSRLGDIYRLMQNRANAVTEYKLAIAEFKKLASRYPRKLRYQQDLAYAHNWLGETVRSWLEQDPSDAPFTAAEAADQYDNALRIQQSLHESEPAKAMYAQELARTFYNRGILKFDSKDPTGAEADFRSALNLLQPLVQRGAADAPGSPPAIEELGRVYSNLGNLLTQENRFDEAEPFFRKAISGHEELLKTGHGNRESRLELATFHNGLSILLLKENRLKEARDENAEASRLLSELAAPPPALVNELAKSAKLRQYLGSGRH